MKNKLRLQILVIVISIIVVLIVGPRILLNEPHFVQKWITEVSEKGNGITDKNALLLKLEKNLIVCDAQGNYRLYPLSGYANAGFGYYSDVSQNKNENEIRTLDGKNSYYIQKRLGFPMFFERNIVFVDGTALSFSVYDYPKELKSGTSLTEKFVYQTDAPITGIELVGKDRYCILKINGDIDLIDQSGAIKAQFHSNAEGIAIGFEQLSDEVFALVLRSEKERLYFINIQNNAFNILREEEIDGLFSRDILLEDIGDGRLVAEQENGLDIISVDGNFQKHLTIQGWIRKVIKFPIANSFVLMRDAPDGSFIEIYNANGIRISSFGPSSKIQDFGILDSQIMVMGEEGLVCYDYLEK